MMAKDTMDYNFSFINTFSVYELLIGANKTNNTNCLICKIRIISKVLPIGNPAFSNNSVSLT